MNQILKKPSFLIKKKEVSLPSSKSILNRLIFIISLSKKKIIIKNTTFCSDTIAMLSSLNDLGKKIKINGSTVIISGKLNKKSKKVFFYNSGLTARIITMYILLNIKKKIYIEGNTQLNNRPMIGIVEIYNKLSYFLKNNIYSKKKGYLPFKIKPKKKVKISNKISSQYITAFLLNINKLNKKKIILKLENTVSNNYIKMTILIMKKMGIKIKYKKNYIFYKKSKFNYKKKYSVESDCSSASYFFLSSLFKKKYFKESVLSKIQTEIYFLNFLKNIGVKIFKKNKKIFLFYEKKKINSISIDCKSIIDTSISICIMTILNFVKKIKLYNIYNWNLKECKRIFAISKECKILGLRVIKGINWIIFMKNKFRNVIIKNYNDHRICMTFSILLKKKKVVINKPNSVKKTFPNFYKKL